MPIISSLDVEENIQYWIHFIEMIITYIWYQKVENQGTT